MWKVVPRRTFVAMKYVDTQRLAFRFLGVPEPSAKRVEQAERAAQSAICKFVEIDDWRRVDLADLSLKYKVVTEGMRLTGRKVSSADLSNIIDAPSLVECLSGKWQLQKEYSTLNEFKVTDPVMKFFQRTADLPSNMYWLNGRKKARTTSKPTNEQAEQQNVAQ